MSTKFKFDRHGLTYFIAEVTDRTEYTVSFSVHEVIGYGVTEDGDLIKPYCKVMIKWDGCSHINYVDEDGDNYKHLCGAQYVLYHVEMMAWLYVIAYPLIEKASDSNYWESDEHRNRLEQIAAGIPLKG